MAILDAESTKLGGHSKLKGASKQIMEELSEVPGVEFTAPKLVKTEQVDPYSLKLIIMNREELMLQVQQNQDLLMRIEKLPKEIVKLAFKWNSHVCS